MKPLFELSLIITSGLVAQWLAWFFRVPSILLLLLLGGVLGSWLGLVNPDVLFGTALFPLVQLAVGLILFEGGLSLKFREVKSLAAPIFGLVFVGMLVTCLGISIAAKLFLGLPVGICLLLGAILSVSGPTVILPLLRQLRMSATLNSVLKWEGILIDPVGALLAVLVLDAIIAGTGDGSWPLLFFSWGRTAAIGSGIGVAAGLFLAALMKRFLLPDYLLNPVAFAIVIAAFALAEAAWHEAGLFSVTVMGITLANFANLDTHRILAFKEDLRVLLISCLFIILAARMDIAMLFSLDMNALWFVIWTLFLVRPLAVLISTIGSNLKLKEKLFLTVVSPRGIVAAAVASLFVIELSNAGIENADAVGTYTFLIIFTSIISSSLLAPLAATLLGVKEKNPSGILVVGASSPAVSIAKELKKLGVHVALIDTNWSHVMHARNSGLQCVYGNVLSDESLGALNLEGIGKYVGFTGNEEANILGALKFKELFGSAEVYHLSSETKAKSMRQQPTARPHLTGRILFGKEWNYDALSDAMTHGALTLSHKIDDTFSMDELKEQFPEVFVPLFNVKKNGAVSVATVDRELNPVEGDQLIFFAKP